MVAAVNALSICHHCQAATPAGAASAPGCGIAVAQPCRKLSELEQPTQWMDEQCGIMAEPTKLSTG
jgi:hypothetical protein